MQSSGYTVYLCNVTLLFACNNVLYLLCQIINGPREHLLSPQLLGSGRLVKDTVRGILQTREELDEYERLWHCHIYQPTWDQLEDKVRQ